MLASCVVLAGCGGNAAGSASAAANQATATPSIAPDVLAVSAGAASPPANLTLTVTDPKEGAIVPAGNVTVSYDVGGSTLGPDYQAGVLLDVDATPYLQQFKPIPTSDDHVVLTSDKSVSFRSVAAGSHTVTVILATATNHLSLSPPRFYKVTFQTQ